MSLAKRNHITTAELVRKFKKTDKKVEDWIANFKEYFGNQKRMLKTATEDYVLQQTGLTPDQWTLLNEVYNLLCDSDNGKIVELLIIFDYNDADRYHNSGDQDFKIFIEKFWESFKRHISAHIFSKEKCDETRKTLERLVCQNRKSGNLKVVKGYEGCYVSLVRLNNMYQHILAWN